VFAICASFQTAWGSASFQFEVLPDSPSIACFWFTKLAEDEKCRLRKMRHKNDAKV
jgi:hypothetical protein